MSLAWSVSREIRTAPSRNGSAGDRSGGGGRCRLSRRPNPDRGLGVAVWGHRAVRTSPGGPPGQSPPRRRYRSRHLREFPVSPHFGREPRSGSSGNTARLQRFSRNKEADGQPSLSHRPRREKAHPSSPTRSLRGQGSMSRFQARGPTPRHLFAYQLAKGPQSSLHQPSDANGAAGEPLTPAPRRPRLPEPSRPHAGRFAGLSPLRPDGGRTDPRGRSCSHLASPPATPNPARAPKSSLAPRISSTENPSRAPLTCCAPRQLPSPHPFLLLLLLRLLWSSLLPRPSSESPTLPGSRFNPGRRCPSAQGNTPKRRSQVTSDRGRGRTGTAVPGGAGRAEGGERRSFLQGKPGTRSRRDPEGARGTLPSPAGSLGLERSASPSRIPWDPAGRRRVVRVVPEHSSLDSARGFWGAPTESPVNRPSPGPGDPPDLCALGEDPGICFQGPLARALEPKDPPQSSWGALLCPQVPSPSPALRTSPGVA